MTTPHDDILEELYTIDPSLREHEGALRELLAVFSDAKPSVSIDETFVAHLRDRLFGVNKRTEQAPGHTVGWWFFHLAPIGAVAILILMLVPLSLGPIYNTGTEMLTYDTELAPEAPSAKMAARDGEEPAQPSLMSTEVTSTTLLPGNSFAVGVQTPGSSVIVDFVSLETPAFVVIRAYAGDTLGDVVGVSTLLPAGHTERFSVPLEVPLVENNVYAVTLVTDNGDEVYEEDDDAPILDAYLGVPMYTTFGVTKEEVPATETN